MKRLFSLALLGCFVALCVSGCSNDAGGKPTEVKAAPTDLSKDAQPAMPPNGVSAPAAQNQAAFAEAMKKQAKEGIPK